MSFRPQGEIPKIVAYKQCPGGFLIPPGSIRIGITDFVVKIHKASSEKINIQKLVLRNQPI
jgi:hypothetical protein